MRMYMFFQNLMTRLRIWRLGVQVPSSAPYFSMGYGIIEKFHIFAGTIQVPAGVKSPYHALSRLSLVTEAWHELDFNSGFRFPKMSYTILPEADAEQGYHNKYPVGLSAVAPDVYDCSLCDRELGQPNYGGAVDVAIFPTC